MSLLGLGDALHDQCLSLSFTLLCLFLEGKHNEKVDATCCVLSSFFILQRDERR